MLLYNFILLLDEPETRFPHFDYRSTMNVPPRAGKISLNRNTVSQCPSSSPFEISLFRRFSETISRYFLGFLPKKIPGRKTLLEVNLGRLHFKGRINSAHRRVKPLITTMSFIDFDFSRVKIKTIFPYSHTIFFVMKISS